MTWVIASGPHAVPWEGRDVVAWAWELEDDGAGLNRRVVVDVSGTAMATAPAFLPEETRRARETHGRSEVERVLAIDEPPRRIALGTTGRVRTAEGIEPGWSVLLRGRRPDLAVLARLFSGPRIDVRGVEEETYLRSDAFAAAGDAGDVRSRAAALLREAIGIARIYGNDVRPVEVDRVTQVDETGGRRQFVEVRDAFEVDEALGVTPVGGRPGQTADRSLDTSAELARSSPRVARVLRILGNPEPDWAQLYHVLDAVQEDVGGRMFSEGWVTRTSIDLFTHTANNAQVLGEHARHGHERWQPPRNPMSLEDARALVHTLVRHWLEDQASAG